MPATLDQTCNHGTLASDAIVTSLQGVNKNYGNIRALRGVDFRVRAGKSAQPLRQDHCREIAARPHSTHFRKNAGFQRRPRKSGKPDAQPRDVASRASSGNVTSLKNPEPDFVGVTEPGELLA